jgi:hypothetical protein
MDFLAKWIEKLCSLRMLHLIFFKCKNMSFICDDTLFLLKPKQQQLKMIQLVLKIFHKLSGLRVNLQKSELLVTSMPFCQVSRLAQLIECKPIEFPLIYLGLSLSNKAITKGYYQKLIDSIQNRLPGCYASKLSMAGRIVILNSVISAITMYHMTVFMLPEWVIKAIDRIRRQFL